MTIYIAHLYYDLMNLYGEIGNIKALERALKNQGIKVVVDKVSINDSIDFNKYDLIYIGSGTKCNQDIVLNDILKYKEDIKNYIENNKFFISTGNSYELFGKSIDSNNALEIFNYNSITTNKRIVGDSLVTCDFINKKILGFLNQGSIIENNDNPMFKVISSKVDDEGINYKNFYGTYLLGPLLIRNTELLKYVITKLIKNKDKKYKLKSFNLKLEEKAYQTYMNEYHKEN